MNKPYDFAIAGVFSALLSVLISYFLVRYFGLTGAAIGSLVMDILLFIYIFPKGCKLIGQPISSLFKDTKTDYLEIWYNRIGGLNSKKHIV